MTTKRNTTTNATHDAQRGPAFARARRIKDARRQAAQSGNFQELALARVADIAANHIIGIERLNDGADRQEMTNAMLQWALLAAYNAGRNDALEFASGRPIR